MRPMTSSRTSRVRSRVAETGRGVLATVPLAGTSQPWGGGPSILIATPICCVPATYARGYSMVMFHSLPLPQWILPAPS